MKKSDQRYSRGSEAYDFDLFLPKPKTKNNVVQLPHRDERIAPRTRMESQTRVKPKVKQKIKINPAKAKRIAARTAAITVCAALLMLNLASRAQYNELAIEISAAQGVQAELLDAEKNLNQQLQSKVSYDNLEEEAQDLGMAKADPSQKEYVVLNEDESLTVLDE